MTRICLKTLLLVLLLVVSSCGPKKADYELKKDTGIASWYGSDFHGRPTASGEPYDMHALTAAHRTLPFGTRLRVTNIENGRDVTVTVNDRGPFVRGRFLDLSYGAAKRLDMVGSGTARVRIEPAGRDSSYVKHVKAEEAGKGDFTVQLGSFTRRDYALRLKKVLSWKYEGVYMTKAKVEGKTFYRVRIGSFSTRKDAVSFAETLAEEGYEVVVMRRF